MSSSLDPDQARRFAGTGMGSNCLQRLVAGHLITYNFITPLAVQKFVTAICESEIKTHLNLSYRCYVLSQF